LDHHAGHFEAAGRARRTGRLADRFIDGPHGAQKFERGQRHSDRLANARAIEPQRIVLDLGDFAAELQTLAIDHTP